ncbi:MAG: hypothetical protein Q8R22_02755 [Flavobacterium sp.]|uniref:hypothetical protein n=1 Tax=Flavobacterium sp. TaxID=239 RepID=UPI00273428E0|nr:hypothetical protein [Flavobacterium sp.]MDP3679738.1 hypothetical protein [Flavobacterium sp.]MDZ4329172.1 hypothetical protein [Flavobacterium sp.]
MAYQYYNNIIAVEHDELVPKFWNTLSSLQQEIHRYKDKPFGIKRLQLGGNGRKLLIDFDTLKPTIQEALGDPRRVDNPLENFFEFDADAVRYYSRFKRSVNTLEPEEQERYIINASVMKAVIKLEQARTQERIKLKGSLRGITATLVKDVENFNNTLKVKHEVSHNLPASEKQFKKLLNACKEDLYYPLIKDPKGGKTNNARKVCNQTETLLNSLFAKQLHKPTPTEVAKNYDGFLNGYVEVYNTDSGEVYNPKDFKSLSNATIINYINKWENKIANYKVRSGDRQVYMGNFTPSHQMDLPVYSGSIISIDDRNPPFWYEKGKRAWFYIGCDIASQCFTTVVYGKSKEGIIVDFYRQMVRNHAEWGLPIPNELECESSLNSTFRDTLLRNGGMFQSTRIIPNKASGKYIERMFGKVRYDVEKSEIGWIARPFAKSEANQSSSIPTTIIPYDELINERMLGIEKWNNMPHPSNPTMSRFDYFMQNQHPEIQPTNWEAILPVIGYKTETSCQVGYVSLQKVKRAIAEDGKILTGDALIQKMRVIEGKELDVYWIDGNDGKVLKSLVYLRGTTRLICEIMELPRYNRASLERTPEQDAARTLQSAYVASVEAFSRSQIHRLENIGITDNTPQTVNSNFKFSNLKRYEAREEPVEVFADDTEEDLVYVPSQNIVPGWRSNFNL